MSTRPSKVSLLPTPGQVKIAALLAQGMSTAKAAAELALATGTVSAQVSSAHHRLGVCHRYGLIHACYVHALIPRPDTALPPGGADADEVQILWRLALDDSYDEITRNATLSSREVMKEKFDALRSRWDAVNDPHLITLGWRYGVLDASRGTGGHQLI